MFIVIARLYLKVPIIMENNIVQFLSNKNLTLAVAESFTGGSFAAYVTDIPGSSLVFKGSVITYFNDAKTGILNIPSSLINQYGSISKECGIAMASNVQKLFNSDIGVSFTGNAGPTAHENKAVGEVYITIIYQQTIYSFPLLLKGSRKAIKKQSILYAITQIFDIISKV
jgi:PncC family amidohydrolase